MTGTKVLQINPLLFSKSNGDKHSKTLKNKPQKEKPTQMIKGTGTMRKALLAKIRDFQKKDNDMQPNNSNATNSQSTTTTQNNTSSQTPDALVKDFDNEFNKSLGFLNELSKKHQDKKKVKKEIKQSNKTLKHNNTTKSSYDSSLPLVNIDLPLELELSNTNAYSVVPSNKIAPTSQNNSSPLNHVDILGTFVKSNTGNASIRDNPIMNDNIFIKHQDDPISLNNYKKMDVDKKETTMDIREKPDDHRKNIKQSITHVSSQQSNNATNTNTSTFEPPYSNLKNGNKPSFKEWSRLTQKVRPKPISTIINPTINIDAPLIHKPGSSSALSELKQMHHNKKKQTPVITKLIKRKTKTLKYNLGKKGKHISVLIKNNNTRKKIKHEQSILRQKPIQEIKDYLRNKNLIKSGTLAPNDVLREMYEQAILTGEVHNTSKDTLVHNFFNA